MNSYVITTSYRIKSLIISLVLFFFCTNVNAQVLTRILKDQSIEDIIPKHFPEEPYIYNLPDVDIEKVLKEDSLRRDALPRFGVKINTDFNINDGTFYYAGDIIHWKIGFRSKDALSLNFRFSNLNLPENSQMFIYDKSQKMIIGPIEQKQVNNNKLSTDIIYGDEATIEVILLEQDKEKFSIQLDRIVHGIKKIGFEERDFGDADPCQIDVNCTQGTGWEKERDAVALTFWDNQFHCSGALINDACRDLKPYFLTAFHCLDNGDDIFDFQNGFLSQAELNSIQNMAFRFHYESPNPTTANNCHGSEPTTWLTFSGANFRSAWSGDDWANGTDFALLELMNPVAGFSDLALAGWDRTNIIPTSTRIIHHPTGDVKKISIDNDPPIVTTIWPNQRYYETHWDEGIIEGGSSGAPLFNSNKRIVGTVNKGNTPESCGSPLANGFCGRIYRSWTGLSSPSTRLSDWLGGGSNPSVVNTIRPPSIQGNSLICTTSTFQLINAASGVNISWTVSPTNLFTSATSGSGSSATLTPSALNSGLATLTYTSSGGSTCTPIVLTKQIWVGKPNVTLSGSMYICPGQLGTANVIYNGNTYGTQGVTNIQWSYTGPLSYFSGINSQIQYKGFSQGSGFIQAIVTNPCGSTTVIMPYHIVSCILDGGGDDAISIFPNPGNDLVTISVDKEKANIQENEHVIIEVFDLTGDLILKSSPALFETPLDISSLSPGVFILRVTCNAGIFTKKMIVE